MLPYDAKDGRMARKVFDTPVLRLAAMATLVKPLCEAATAAVKCPVIKLAWSAEQGMVYLPAWVPAAVCYKQASNAR